MMGGTQLYVVSALSLWSAYGNGEEPCSLYNLFQIYCDFIRVSMADREGRIPELAFKVVHIFCRAVIAVAG